MTNQSAQILYKARIFLQLNQRDFAGRFGKTQTTLSRYESGKVRPPSDIVMQCMHILNEDNVSDEIEQIINKIKMLEGEQYKSLREALNTLLNKCIF